MSWHKACFFLCFVIVLCVSAFANQQTESDSYATVLSVSGGSGQITSETYTQETFTTENTADKTASESYNTSVGRAPQIFPDPSNVSGVNNSQEESNESSGGGSSGSGGGTSGQQEEQEIPVKIIDFTTRPRAVSLDMYPGDTKRVQLSLVNNGEFIVVKLGSSGDGIVEPEEQTVNLDAQESKEISLVVTLPHNQKPGILRRVIRAEGGEKEVSFSVIINVKERRALFDVSAIPHDQKHYLGSALLAQISLKNLGSLKPVDALMYYSIEDLDGGQIYQEHETLAITDELHYNKTLMLPASMQPGEYLLKVEARYDNQTATASQIISVEYPLSITFKDLFSWGGKEKAQGFIAMWGLILLIASGLCLICMRPFYAKTRIKNWLVTIYSLIEEEEFDTAFSLLAKVKVRLEKRRYAQAIAKHTILHNILKEIELYEMIHTAQRHAEQGNDKDAKLAMLHILAMAKQVAKSTRNPKVYNQMRQKYSQVYALVKKSRKRISKR